jgi:dienelactone hydrolase
MRHLHRLALATTLLIASPIAAQLEKVGYFPTSFANPTSSGSKNLTVQVHYPATSTGRNAPLKKIAGGWPVVVFLHGYVSRASNYAPPANFIAARGYVVVICDTGNKNTDTEATDGIALYSAVASENASSTGFFRNALDPKRVGLTGHSMGGGNTVRILANNPGYLAGVPLAPWNHKEVYNRDYAKLYAAKVKTPMAIVHGKGDSIVGWDQGKRFYDLSTNYKQLKTLYALNNDCDHSNIAGGRLSSATDRAVFDRVMTVLVGFMDTYVKGDTTGLEQVLGPTARAEPRLSQLFHDIGQTELWLTGSTTLGGKFHLQAMAKQGPTALAAGLRAAPVTTVFGPLVLNSAAIVVINQTPSSALCLQTTTLQIPNNPVFKGLGVTFQALGSNSAGALQLTGGVDAKVQ